MRNHNEPNPKLIAIHDRAIERAMKLNKLEGMLEKFPVLADWAVGEGRRPDINVLDDLATYLHQMTPHWLVSGEKDPFDVRISCC